MTALIVALVLTIAWLGLLTWMFVNMTNEPVDPPDLHEAIHYHAMKHLARSNPLTAERPGRVALRERMAYHADQRRLKKAKAAK